MSESDASSEVAPQIVIGLVGVIGTDMEVACSHISGALKAINYACESIRLSELLESLPDKISSKLKKAPFDKRYTTYMDGGNALREELERGDAMTGLAV